MRGIVLPTPSNQIKNTFIIILPFNLVHFIFIFSCFHIEIEGKGGWIIGGGGVQSVCSPLSNYLGGLPPSPLRPPLPTPMILPNTQEVINMNIAL